MSNPYLTNYGAQFGFVIDDATDPHYYTGPLHHSFRDWELYPTEKPKISPPTPKTLTVDIPGADGNLDFTETLTGDVKYNNRPGEFNYVYLGDRKNWDRVYHTILNALHGRKMAVRIDEEIAGYYYGRFTVDEPRYKNKRFYLTITADLEPYLYDLETSDAEEADEWIWDTFDFNTGVIRYYKNIEINNTDTSNPTPVTLIGSMRTVSPIVWRDTGSVITMHYTNYLGESKTLLLSNGNNVIPDFIMRGDTTVYFNGRGTISIHYRGGML